MDHTIVKDVLQHITHPQIKFFLNGVRTTPFLA